MDYTAAVAEIGNATSAITAIGGAVLVVLGVLMAFRMAKRALG
jgi:hypothetical protein|tara:strand:- start:4720 stop:4848 length:129 start_codon:yes stop_codon:yes gene_type:complete